MSLRVAAVLSTLALAAPAAAQGDLPPFGCRTFPKDASSASLAKAFGAANVIDADIEAGEGTTERGTVLFPKDPRRRVEILWFDTANRRRPASVSVRERSDWAVRTAGGPQGGIRIGTPIDFVQTANAKPFAITGFEWDMGGWVSGWKGGTLDAMEGGCTLMVRFTPKVEGPALDQVSGDRTFSSSALAVRAVNPVVTTLSLGWGE